MSKGQSKVTDRVDVEDYHEDQVAASNNERQTIVRDSDIKGWHVLKHDKGIDVNNCNTEVFESLGRSFIEDGDARKGSAIVADFAGSIVDGGARGVSALGADSAGSIVKVRCIRGGSALKCADSAECLCPKCEPEDVDEIQSEDCRETTFIKNN